MKRTVACCVMSCCLVAMTGCEQDDGPKISPTIKNINQDPAAYLGREVTVMGEIEEKYGPGLFRLNGPAWLQDEILVFTPDDRFVVEGEKVWVHGPVRLLEVMQVEEELGLDLDPELEVEYESAPVLMSKDVSLRSVT